MLLKRIIIDLLINFKSANFYLYLFNKSLLYNNSSVVEYDKFFINVYGHSYLPFLCISFKKNRN